MDRRREVVILSIVYLFSFTVSCQAQEIKVDSGGDKKDPNERWHQLFNGKDLTGWKRHEGLPDHGVAGRWFVEDNAIVGMQDPPGKGGFLSTLGQFGDFDLILETKVDRPFDSGVFLRVGPDGKSHQVTLDYRDGGEIGGIYCPWTHGFVYHCPDGARYFKKDQWNKVRIICCGDPAQIRVWVNDIGVTDYQHTKETTSGIPREGTLCLQVHPGGEGYDKSKARFKNVFIRSIKADSKWVLTEQEAKDGFVLLFNGVDLSGWTGAVGGYCVQDGKIICKPDTKENLYTEAAYGDFVLRFEFRLTAGANNGLGIRTAIPSYAAYEAVELQILDNTADEYKDLKPYQYHGSIYGVVPAKREYLRPVGQWNFQEVIAKGRQITVNLNGTTIVDANIDQAAAPKTMDGREHPGLARTEGHIAFLGHSSQVEFCNIRIKRLN